MSRSGFALGFTILAAALFSLDTRAEVRSLTLGIDTNCPYGLAE